MLPPIKGFYLDNAFLSNSYQCRIYWKDKAYPSVTHAFLAEQCPEMRDEIASTPLDYLDNLSGQIIIHEMNDREKFRIMEEILVEKFTRTKALMYRLVATGEQELINENREGDTFWGTVNGEGENYLGEILMELRIRFRKDYYESLAYAMVKKSDLVCAECGTRSIVPLLRPVHADDLYKYVKVHDVGIEAYCPECGAQMFICDTPISLFISSFIDHGMKTIACCQGEYELIAGTTFDEYGIEHFTKYVYDTTRPYVGFHGHDPNLKAFYRRVKYIIKRYTDFSDNIVFKFRDRETGKWCDRYKEKADMFIYYVDERFGDDHIENMKFMEEDRKNFRIFLSTIRSHIRWYTL